MVESRFRCRDQLSLFFRDFPPENQDSHHSQEVVLCLPGLTRNSRDFQFVADRYSKDRRVICPDLRGRGFSDWDPNFSNYVPATYLLDVLEIIDNEGLISVHIIGTSLGGILAQLIALNRPSVVASVVLNDIGPELDPRGLERIRSYTGKLGPVYSWEDAVAQSKVVYGKSLVGLDEDQWLAWARCSYREDANGNIQLDMDPKIGDAIRESDPMSEDPWLMFRALHTIPCLAIRGALSDLLSAETLGKMHTEKPDLLSITVNDRGHTPLLNEPEVVQTLDDFYAQLSEGKLADGNFSAPGS